LKPDPTQPGPILSEPTPGETAHSTMISGGSFSACAGDLRVHANSCLVSSVFDSPFWE